MSPPFLLPTRSGLDDRTVLVDADAGSRLSLAELRDAVAVVAARLRAEVKRLAFVLCENDPRTVVAYLGAIEAGCAVALLDRATPARFAAELVRRYEPGWILGATEAIASLAGGERATIDVGGVTILALDRRAGEPANVHDDLALLLSTSGSTGSPKLVRLRRASVEHNAGAIADALSIDEDERAIGSLPLHYSYGLSVLDSHLARGASVVFTRHPLSSAPFWDVVRRERCTSFAGVPFAYAILRRLDLDKLAVPTVRTLTQAGGRLDPAQVAHFAEVARRRDGRMFVMYGQTEATARMAIVPPARLSEKLGSAGLALAGGRFFVEADAVPVVEPEREGEIVYGGPNVMMGYAESRADLGRGDDLGGVLRTGDLGRLDREGFLFVTGRSKRIAKVYGARINLDEVEAMVRPHGSAAALAGQDEIAIACEFGDEETFSTIRRELADLLKVQRHVLRFRRVEALPRTASGKIDYPRLSALS